MRKDSFAEFLGTLRTQDVLRSNGYKPVGWSNGYLVWSREDSGSVCTVLNDVRHEDVVPLDSMNALLSR